MFRQLSDWVDEAQRRTMVLNHVNVEDQALVLLQR